jgi:hypothetical protein
MYNWPDANNHPFVRIVQYVFLSKTTQVLHTSQIDLPSKYCDIQE